MTVSNDNAPTNDDTSFGDNAASNDNADDKAAKATTPDSETAPESGTESTVRSRSWSCAGPAQLDVTVEVGRIEVSLSEQADAVEVELRADPERGGWSRGLSGLLNRIGGATGPGGSIRIGGREINFGQDFSFGGHGFDLSELADVDLDAEAVRAAEIDWSESGRRLTVRSSTRIPLRAVPLVVTLRAPVESRLTLRTGSGRISVTGRAGHTDARTGAGDIELDAVHGDLRMDTGSGGARAHTVSGRTMSKTGSGTLVLDVLDGPAVLKSGSGDIRLGAVRADIQAKTGSGDLSVADAERGRLSLDTGSGDLTVAIHAGVAAELDLRSGSGRTRSELEVSTTAPSGGPVAVSVQGRTGNGDVLVTRALD
jgi:putative adhesin